MLLHRQVLRQRLAQLPTLPLFLQYLLLCLQLQHLRCQLCQTVRLGKFILWLRDAILRPRLCQLHCLPPDLPQLLRNCLQQLPDLQFSSEEDPFIDHVCLRNLLLCNLLDALAVLGLPLLLPNLRDCRNNLHQLRFRP